MSLKGSLLEGIQSIPGDTAGEKFKYINNTAKEIANEKCDFKVFPVVLEPLAKVEVAKILNQTEEIVKALLSNDALLCSRALQIPNLFIGESPFLKWDYFYSELLSRVSLVTRYKLIKKVTNDLQNKDPTYAEEFYLGITKTYGKKVALPLLLHCREQFINDEVMQDKIVLPVRILTNLFFKYPNFVISYLRINQFNEDTKSRKRNSFDLDDYSSFLPNLIDDHFDTFIELCETEKAGEVELGKSRTKQFLQKGSSKLVGNPKLFLPMLSEEIVSKKLSEDTFSQMLAQLLPKNMDKFNYDDINYGLRYFQNDKKVTIICSAFHKAYNKSLLDYNDKIPQTLLAILPVEERIKQAKIKLQKDSTWDKYEYNECWICYLPTKDVIDDLTKKISLSSNYSVRERLLKMMIFNCKINNDMKCLLEVLEYLSRRHKNEKRSVIQNVLKTLHCEFNMDELEESHWKIIDDIIRRDIIMAIEKFAYNYLILDRIKFLIKRNLSIDEHVSFLIKIGLNTFLGTWNLFEETLENMNHRRIFYNKLLELMADELNKNRADEERKHFIISRLINLVTNFNRNIKLKKSIKLKIEPLRIEDFPSFIEILNKNINTIKKNHSGLKYTLIRYTKLYSSDLHKKWFSDETLKTNISVTLDELMIALRKDYTNILDQWESYLEYCIEYLHFPKNLKFLKASIWYKDLPIKFLEGVLKDIETSKTSESSVLLGVFFQGQKYEELLELWIPNDVPMKLDLKVEESKEMHKLIHNWLNGTKFTNPSIRIDVFKRFFGEDYLPIVSKVILSTACKTSSPVVTEFANGFLKERVAISKLMIEILCVSSTMEYKREMLSRMWKTNSHPSIKGVLITKIWKLFKEQPNEQMWNLVKSCLDNFDLKDRKILQQLSCFKNVPDEYISLYVTEVFNIFENVNVKGDPDLSKDLMSDIFSQFNESYCDILPTEFQEKLISKYIFEAAFDPMRAQLGESFIFKCYLKGKDLAKRISNFTDIFRKFAVDKFDEKVEDSYPANVLIRDIIHSFILYNRAKKVDINIVESLQSVFNTVSNPWQDTQSFLYLTWIKHFQEEKSVEELGNVLGRTLNEIVLIFGAEFLIIIGKTMKFFIDDVYADQNMELKFLDSLIATKCNHAYFCAAYMLTKLSLSTEKQYHYIDLLMKTNIPIVNALLYKKYVFL